MTGESALKTPADGGEGHRFQPIAGDVSLHLGVRGWKTVRQCRNQFVRSTARFVGNVGNVGYSQQLQFTEPR
jgi:hypothetical protein